MNSDKAATLLATYALTGSVRETARQLNLAPSTVSAHLRHAGIVAAENPSVQNNSAQKKNRWIKAWGQRESRMLELIDEKAPAARFRDVAVFAGIAADKRYREEHPESVRGVVIDQSQHVHVEGLIDGIREARAQLRDSEPGGPGQLTEGPGTNERS